MKIAPYSSSNVLAFNGAENKETNVKKETHAGIKAGGITAGLQLSTVALASHYVGGARWGRVGLIAALTTGCGALVDAMINNKFKKGEENNAIGKKYGTLLGVGAGVVNTIIINGKHAFSKRGLIGMAIVSGISALGGLVLGAITDHCANKTARKADEAVKS